MALVLRQATQADVQRIVSISTQVWDGEDYIAGVIDEWLADPRGAVVVAVAEGEVVGYGRWVQLWTGYLWMEGLRVDPAFRGQGIARALTRYLCEAARLQGAERVALSTYLDNTAAIRVTEKDGFQRVASFIYTEAKTTVPACTHEQLSPHVQVLDTGTALDFISHSAFMRASQGFFPHGWCFLPFAAAPEAVFARMRWILGIRRGSQVIAMLCSGHPRRHQQECTIDFVDGEPEAVEILLRHALALARRSRTVEVMMPYTAPQPLAALSILTRFGFELEHRGEADVFVYEKTQF